MAHAHLGSALGRGPRRGHLQAQPVQAAHQHLGDRHRFLADVVDGDALPGVQGGSHPGQPDDAGGAREKARDAGGGPEFGRERKGLGVAEPAAHRVGEQRLPALGHIEEGGRAGAAVEELVRAADRHVDIPGVELDRHRARAVGQVPTDQGAGGVRLLCAARHVEHAAGAVIDMREGEHGRGGVQVLSNLATAQLGDALGDVEIRREVVPGRGDAPAA